MAFSSSKFAKITSGQAQQGSIQFFSYLDLTVDTLATIEGSGFFNDYIRQMKVNDIMFLVGTNGANMVSVSSVTTNVTVAPYTTAVIAPDSITTDMLQDGCVTEPKLHDDAVSTNKIVLNAVTADKLATNSVTTNKITDLNVTEGKIANGAVTNTKLGTNSVSTIKIQDSAITYAKLNAEVKFSHMIRSSQYYSFAGGASSYSIGDIWAYSPFIGIYVTMISNPNSRYIVRVESANPSNGNFTIYWSGDPGACTFRYIIVDGAGP